MNQKLKLQLHDEVVSEVASEWAADYWPGVTFLREDKVNVTAPRKRKANGQWAKGNE